MEWRRLEPLLPRGRRGARRVAVAQECRERVFSCERRSLRRHCRDPTERDLAANDALACIGLEAIDPRGLLRDALPDQQQEPGDEVDRAGRELWDGCELRAPAGLELYAIGLDPIMLG